MQEAFRQATRQSLERSLETPADWDRYKAIIVEADARLALAIVED